MFLIFSCSVWEYEDPSLPYENHPPETYLSLVASDTIYAIIDEISSSLDSTTGEIISDTIWYYELGEISSDSSVITDTLPHAFTTISTSRQELHWWGEDTDGEVIGYKYRWNTDTSWTETTNESALFIVPITKTFDVFQFEVSAIDNDGILDQSPSQLVLPIRNSFPEISFKHLSNPLSADLPEPKNVHFTFPTRTFIWDVSDPDELDGKETVISIFYALDDTCGTCWTELDAAAYSSITLSEIEPGFHNFYIKARDIAGADSKIISFPDSTNTDEPDYWRVMPVQGDVLVVDDFDQDIQNNTLEWYEGILDSILGENNHSTWEIGKKLPYSPVDISANLNYFSMVLWFTAYTGIETYEDASSNILNYVMGGGNLFLNASELNDVSFSFFPLDSSFVINENGRLLSGRTLIFQDSSEVYENMDLETSRLIAIKVKSFIPADNDTIDNSIRFESENLYRLQEPENTDTWTGTPNVCSRGQFHLLSSSEKSGKIVLMSLPLHNGIYPLMEGNGSSTKFIDYLLTEEFAE